LTIHPCECDTLKRDVHAFEIPDTGIKILFCKTCEGEVQFSPNPTIVRVLEYRYVFPSPTIFEVFYDDGHKFQFTTDHIFLEAPWKYHQKWYLQTYGRTLEYGATKEAKAKQWEAFIDGVLDRKELVHFDDMDPDLLAAQEVITDLGRA